MSEDSSSSNIQDDRHDSDKSDKENEPTPVRTRPVHNESEEEMRRLTEDLSRIFDHLLDRTYKEAGTKPKKEPKPSTSTAISTSSEDTNDSPQSPQCSTEPNPARKRTRHGRRKVKRLSKLTLPSTLKVDSPTDTETPSSGSSACRQTTKAAKLELPSAVSTGDASSTSQLQVSPCQVSLAEQSEDESGIESDTPQDLPPNVAGQANPETQMQHMEKSQAGPSEDNEEEQASMAFESTTGTNTEPIDNRKRKKIKRKTQGKKMKPSTSAQSEAHSEEEADEPTEEVEGKMSEYIAPSTSESDEDK